VLVGLDEDAEKSAKGLVDKTRAPVLTDLTISGDAFIDASPEHVPDVFAGAPVLAALQVRPSGGELVVRGKLANGRWEQRIQVRAADPGDGNPAVVKLYARERVADLEMRWTIGSEVQAIDREIESIGLVFQIATLRTSWVAIDDDRSVDPRRGTRHEEIPQELPYGTTMASFSAAAPLAQAASFGSVDVAMMLRAPSAPPAARRAMMAPHPQSIARPAAGMPTAAPPAPPAGSIGSAGSAGSTYDESDDDASIVTASSASAFDADTLRPPAPVPAAPAPAQLEQALARPEYAASSSQSRSLETPMLASRPRTSRWLVALIAALVAFVVILAALVAWLLYTR
jgi:Ca-activated chloride channel family protein